MLSVLLTEMDGLEAATGECAAVPASPAAALGHAAPCRLVTLQLTALSARGQRTTGRKHRHAAHGSCKQAQLCSVLA